MSTSLAFISQQVVIYVGLFLFIAGLIGGPLVLLVFLSLKTYRESSCAFYLTVMSFVNIFHLFTGLLTFIMINGFGISWTNMSLFYCKFRIFYVQLCVLTSLTCMCFATIDQFLATCSNPRWHRRNNIKFARYLVIGAITVWFLVLIPFILCTDHMVSATTGISSCGITNTGFQSYYSLFHRPILTSGLPVIIMGLFGILAFRNVQKIAYRTVPLVRRELDKQFTTMTLVHVFYDMVVLTPQIVVVILIDIVGTPSNSDIATKLASILNITSVLTYFQFVVCISLH